MKGLARPSCLLLPYYVIVHVITAALALSTAEYNPEIPSMDLQCMLDGNHQNPELAACLEKGTKYLDRYFTELRWRANMFDRCSELPEFSQCLRPLLHNCPTIRRVYEHWARVLDTLECSCRNKSNTDPCSSRLHCFERQSSGPLVKRCDAYYKFNIDQQTRDRCHFISENIHCKTALMTSACGSDVGDFAFSMYHVTSPRRNKKRICDIPAQPETPAFSYNTLCPASFPDRMEQCRRDHLPQMLSFHKDLDLVALGRKSDIKSACRSYKSYRNCVRQFKMSCKKGMNLMYDYDGRLRTYLAKMEYICSDAKQDYIDHLPCYRDVLRAERLTACDTTWSLLQSMLSTTTPYTYYCRDGSDDTRQLNIVLDEFRQCYENIFADSCGSTGSQTLGSLMASLQHDPRYLRYKYKPDCKLHRPPKREVHRTHTDLSTTTNSSSYSLTPSGLEMSTNDALAVHRGIRLLVLMTSYFLARIAR